MFSYTPVHSYIAGHSRKKNAFLYGCSPSMSWMPDDTDNPALLNDGNEDTSYKASYYAM